nr:hypothetical protein [Candidatus Sigynarchaeum springense]MDO8119669.1 hypothetical protein [Candidatus Sigynarchaeota archaeon]
MEERGHVKELKLLGMTAIVSVALASLLCVGSLAGMIARYPRQEISFVNVAPGSWESISTAINSTERCTVTYSTPDTSLLSIYLMNSSQYEKFMSFIS